MKKLTVLVALCACLSSNAAFAASINDKKLPPCKTQEFAWGTALSSLAVIGVVVGLTAACASGSSN